MAETATKDTRLETALSRFRLVNEAESEQRKVEQADIEFVDLDKQWPEEVKAQRNGNLGGSGGAIAGQPPVPARPCLTFNKIRPSILQVLNQQRNARLALNFAPKRDGASQDVAEAMEDIARGIQTESRAHLARNWAYDRAVKGGRGYYRILTEYANDGDDDLDIVYKRILNQSSVYFDPYAQEPDWSDARFCFLTEDMPWSRYRAEFPNSKLATFEDDELVGIGDDQPSWVGGDDKASRTVRVAEYWYVEHKPRPGGAGGKRTIQDRVVKFCKINAVEILEESDWPGRFIPIVPVIGDETNVNGQRYWQGMVRPAKDAQRSYNYMRSSEVETIGLAPKAPFIVAEGQIEGYESMWQQANTRNFPYLVYKQTTLGGEQAPVPQRNAVEPPIQAIAMAVQEAAGDIKGTLGIFDPSLGAVSSGERSGKAILALQKQAELGSSGFLDNLAQMSMVYEGKILRDLIPKIYTRPGRLVATVGADDEKGAILINTPFITKNGQPVPAPPGTPGAKVIDLTKGEYTVAATVGKSFTTRREEGASAMGELAAAAPQLLPVFADLYVGNLDFPGARQIADRLKKVLPPQVQDGDSPETQLAQLQQQMQLAEQTIQALTAENQKKTQVIETDQVKAQQAMALESEKQTGENQRAYLESQTKIRIAEIQANTQFGVAELKAGLDTAKMRLAHIEELLGHTAEAQQIEQEHAHDAQQMQANREQEAAMAAEDRQFQREEGEAGRQQERELTAAQLQAQREQAKPEARA